MRKRLGTLCCFRRSHIGVTFEAYRLQFQPVAAANFFPCPIPLRTLQISVLVSGKGSEEAGKAAAAINGVTRVFVADSAANYDIAENATELLLALQEKNSM